MATTFEIQIIKKSRVIGSCLYYDYTSLEVLKEVERIVNNYNSNLVGKDSDLNIFALRLFQKSDFSGTNFLSEKNLPFIKGLAMQNLKKRSIRINNGDYDNGMYFSFIKRDRIKNQGHPYRVVTINLDDNFIIANVFRDRTSGGSAITSMELNISKLPFYELEDLIDLVAKDNTFKGDSGKILYVIK